MILVTGASGFVGSAVLRNFAAAGHDVRALIRGRSDRRNLEGIRADIVQGDLLDRPSLDLAVKGCAGVCHVAADYRLWARDPRPIFQANVDGTRNLMLAAGEAGVPRIVYTSSVAVLGIRQDGPPADEETSVAFGDMVGPYKQSKFLAEAEVSRLVREQSLPAVIVNPSAPIGPRDVRPTPTGRLVVEAASGRMPAYVNTGLNVVHVDDVAAGHRLAFERGRIGERYVLGGEDIYLRDMLAEIAGLSGRRPPWIRLAPGLVLPFGYVAETWARLFYAAGKEPLLTADGVRMARKRMFFSSAKARRDLGYASRPAREALRDAVDWFRRHGYLAA